MSKTDWEAALNRYLAGESANDICESYLKNGYANKWGKPIIPKAFAARLWSLKAKAKAKRKKAATENKVISTASTVTKETILTPDLIAEFIWKGLGSEQKLNLIASHITKTLGA